MSVIVDRVKETSTTTGTGTLDLAGAEVGFLGFVAGCGTGAVVAYAIVGRAGEACEGEWEVGIGTVTDATPDTLSRTTILKTHNNNTTVVNFSAGTKDVFLTRPAAWLVRTAKTARRSGGDIAVGSTWAQITLDNGDHSSGDLVIPAVEGDQIEVTINGVWNSGSGSDAGMDVACMVGGSANSWFGDSGGFGTSTGFGVSGLYYNQNAIGSVSAVIRKTLVSGDISSGTVTLRFAARRNGARTLFASGTGPLWFTVAAKNCGQ